MGRINDLVFALPWLSLDQASGVILVARAQKLYEHYDRQPGYKWLYLPGIWLGDFILLCALYYLLYRASDAACPSGGVGSRDVEKQATALSKDSFDGAPDERERNHLTPLWPGRSSSVPPNGESSPLRFLSTGNFDGSQLLAALARGWSELAGWAVRRHHLRAMTAQDTLKELIRVGIVLASGLSWIAGLVAIVCVHMSRMVTLSNPKQAAQAGADLAFPWDQIFAMGTNAATGTAWLPNMWPTTLRALALCVMCGVAVTASRIRLSSTSSRVLAALAAPMLAICGLAHIHLPGSLRHSQNLIVDVLAGIFADPIVLPAVSTTGKGFYGTTNMDRPFLPGLRRIEIKHVFFILLESASVKAFPYTEAFCEEHACTDIDDEFNNADYMTPNFLKFLNSSLDARSLLSATSYSTKSHLSSMCGTMPHIHDFLTEHQKHTALPCLPKLLKAMDENFVAAHFTAGDHNFDNFSGALDKMGYDSYESMFDLVRADLPCTLLSPLMCADDEILPLFTRWLDKQLAQDKRIMASYSSINLHDHYYSVGEPVQYTKSPKTNAYLNALKWTDAALGSLLHALESRGLMDTSLIVIQGDHGDHLSPNPDAYDEMGPHESIYKVPLAIRFPGGRVAGRTPDTGFPHSSFDVLPTILDALGVNPQIIAPYYGRSALRQNATSGRILFTHETPGRTTPMLHDGTRKLTLMMQEGPFCGIDLAVDPTQHRVLCCKDDRAAQPFWWNDDMPADEMEALQPWMAAMMPRMRDHFALNDRYWNAEQAENVKTQEAFLKHASLLASKGQAFDR